MKTTALFWRTITTVNCAILANPVPALQGLDKNARVVYLGSFSSTLFPAIKISYMVLPKEMVEIFDAIKSDYTQTCSKTEQLTLALFMEEGLYYTNIKKLRNLYSQKLQTALAAFAKFGSGFTTPTNTNSGINIILKVRTRKGPRSAFRHGEDHRTQRPARRQPDRPGYRRFDLLL